MDEIDNAENGAEKNRAGQKRDIERARVRLCRSRPFAAIAI